MDSSKNKGYTLEYILQKYHEALTDYTSSLDRLRAFDTECNDVENFFNKTDIYIDNIESGKLKRMTKEEKEGLDVGTKGSMFEMAREALARQNFIYEVEVVQLFLAKAYFTDKEWRERGLKGIELEVLKLEVGLLKRFGIFESGKSSTDEEGLNGE